MWDLVNKLCRRPRAVEPYVRPQPQSWRDRWTPAELAGQMHKLRMRAAFREDYEAAELLQDAADALYELEGADFL